MQQHVTPQVSYSPDLQLNRRHRHDHRRQQQNRHSDDAHQRDNYDVHADAFSSEVGMKPGAAGAAMEGDLEGGGEGRRVGG